MTETDAWFISLYQELYEIAERRMRGEPVDALLQPADLLHEAYLRMAGRPDARWASAAAFYAAAATTMRRVLIDQARARNTRKRGGGTAQRVQLDADELLAPPRLVEAVELDAALSEMAREWPQRGRIVELHFFGGMSLSQISEHLETPLHTVRAEWSAARACLRRALHVDLGPEAPNGTGRPPENG